MCGAPRLAPAAPLFSNLPLQRARQTSPPQAKRVRQVELNPTSSWVTAQPQAMPGRALELNLFSDLVVTGVLDSVKLPGPGRSVMRGHIDGWDGSYFLLARESNVVAGSVFIPKRGTFLIQYAGGGTHLVLETDPAHRLDCGVKVPAPQAEGGISAPLAPAAAAEPEPRALAAASVPIVDVLVLYTPQARDGAGGDLGIGTLIDAAVAEANMVYENSRVNLLLRLAGKAKVTYTESGNLSEDLTRLVTPKDGHLDEVSQLRANCNADLVCLLVENSTPIEGLELAGIAVQNATVANAFSVVQRTYAVGHYVFAHELGHNFGCQHDRANANTRGFYPDSYGNVFQANDWTWGTVMSYPGERIPYFSNPSVQFLGAPTGVAAGPKAANNARTLNLRAATLADFRTPAGLTYAPAVSVTSPANGAVLGFGTNVLLSAAASVRGATVSRVDFYAGDTLVGSSTGPAFQCLWTNAPAGKTTLTAHAISTMQVETVSRAVTVQVKYVNDNFGHPMVLSGTNLVLNFGNDGATMEPGEPQPYGPGTCSVWFSWTAPQSGVVQYSVPGHDFAIYIGIFTGDTLTNLVQVSGSPSGYPTTFKAQAGTRYHIVVGGYTDSIPSGHATLQWQQFPDYTNDNFADATPVSGTSYRTHSNNLGATSEPGESLPGFYGSGYSVWWQWTAPANGTLALSGSGGGGLVGVCLGESVSNIVLVGQGALGSSAYAPALQVPVRTGTTYHILVDGESGWMGSFELGWEFSPGPPPAVATDFANRTALVGPDLTTPVPAGRAAVWFSWMAPADGQLSLESGDTNALVGVFVGDTTDHLIWQGQWGAVCSMMVTAGTTYQFQVVNPPGLPGSLALQFVQYVNGVPNDNFANALLLDGPQVAVHENNAGASREPGEPLHDGYVGLASVWFTWTAPADGVLDIRLEGAGNFFALLGVYAGPSVSNLTCLGAGAFGFPFSAWPELLLPVTNGASLDIAVDGFLGAWRRWGMWPVGDFTLSLNLLPHPATTTSPSASC